MGAYLAKPDTKKDSSSGESKSGHIKYAHTSMQGWRTNMEDAHVTIPNLNLFQNVAFFGVMDGHGGAEVAELLQSKLPEVLADILENLDAPSKKLLNNFPNDLTDLQVLFAEILQQNEKKCNNMTSKL